MSYILAGLATGLGQGMVKQAEAKAAEQESARKREFDIALENLRQQNRIGEIERQADLNDRNTQREYGYQDVNDQKKLPRELKLLGAQTTSQIEVDSARTSNDIRLAQVQGAIARQNDADAAKLAADLESGEIVETLLDENGEYVGITKTGKQKRTRVFAHPINTTPRTYGSGASALFPELEQGSPPAAAPAPAPRATPRPTPASNKGTGKTMTQADIEATAKARGLSKEAAKILLEDLGYRLKP
jgi:hypothetical protein